MSITVIIPTTNRPHFLREALVSVARQSALDRVSCVHVSENMGNLESELVCREFPSLPIRYTRRNPQLPPNDHFLALLSEVETPYLALLHDDDWWASHHLESAMNGLDKNPGTSASYSNFFQPSGPSEPLYCENNFMCWCAAGYPSVAREWLLSAIQIVVASLPGTQLRYSTLVARTEAMNGSAYICTLGNPFDTDRMLGLALALHGPVVYQPVPSTFIRLHPGQDVRNFDDEATNRHMLKTTLWMLDLVLTRNLDLKSHLNACLEACPAAHRPELLRVMQRPFCIDALRQRNCIPESLDRYNRSSRRRSSFLNRFKDWLPPVTVSLARKIFSKNTDD